jgi:hypothetical protein
MINSIPSGEIGIKSDCRFVLRVILIINKNAGDGVFLSTSCRRGRVKRLARRGRQLPLSELREGTEIA